MKCQNKVIHLKKQGKKHDCEWHTCYYGEEVPSNWKGAFKAQGGIYLPEEIPIEEKPEEPIIEEPKVEEKPIVESFGIEDMDKDELEFYAKKEFDVDLDKRKSIKNLRKEVEELING